MNTVSRSAMISFCILSISPLAAASPEDAGSEKTTSWITARASYTSEYATNLRGGRRRTDAYASQVWAGAGMDLANRIGWEGVSASVSVTLRNGDDLGARAKLPLLLQSQEVYGRGSIGRLGQLWVRKDWAAREFSVKAGRMAVGEDFSNLSCDSMALAFCGSQPAMIVGDYWFNAPLSQWAVVFSVKPSATTYLRIGAYQINPTYAHHNAGFRFAPSGTVGTLTPVEFGWRPHARRPKSSQIVVGGWYSSALRPHAWRDTVGGVRALTGRDPAWKSGSYGGYVSVHQQLSDGPHNNSGLRLELNAMASDRRTSAINQTVNAILSYGGLSKARPDDRVSAAVARTQVSLASCLGVSPGRQTAEYMAEFSYTFQAMPGLNLQPVVQYVAQPGGMSCEPDALILGLKVSANL